VKERKIKQLLSTGWTPVGRGRINREDEGG
jgi:hypothetical protein